ncbi:hypothetical protein CEXT_587501 [Caerostris extrusa]|uniref:Uncharacterized protein n=1 Tax=Caerostris extrusa TaxID=172846 RepID=A0AAV4MTN3_CAEEX|nr:hypothetical protein CEXT_587501 [Caerostris extrusa]
MQVTLCCDPHSSFPRWSMDRLQQQRDVFRKSWSVHGAVFSRKGEDEKSPNALSLALSILNGDILLRDLFLILLNLVLLCG